MSCLKCKKPIPDGASFCPWCGKKLVREQAKKKRGNGQGTVIKLPNGKYQAKVILNYYTDEEGKRRRKTRSKVFEKKKDAVAYLPKLKEAKEAKAKSYTFKELYDAWLPTHRAGKDTMNCYKAAFKYFSTVWALRIAEIDIDDLQECVDDCPHGRRTKENMKALCNLLYKFGIPRHAIPENLNLAPYLLIDGDGAAHRSAFDAAQIEKIKNACGKIPHAEDIYCMIYLGFRPSEFLALTAEDYDAARNCLVGGAKTEAGKGRAVTISPKIKAIVAAHAASVGPLFPAKNGKEWELKRYTEDAFYPALEAIGIENPLVTIGGGKLRHKYTPHSCRHTFATLLKNAAGADKDKQALIGHASPEMLRYYQDTPLDDLQKITDIL